MEKLKALLIMVLVAHFVTCDIQTGYVDVNRQLGGLVKVNDNSNTLCYTHVFSRSFGNTPQIATSLVEFATDSSSQFHIQIRVRRIELSRTESKFLIYARREISVWSNIVFAYLASDNDHLVASIATLETEDLSGCGKILQQTFKFPLPASFDKPKVSAFLNGFDVEAKNINSEFSIFEVAIEIVEQTKSNFVVAVSRISTSQIYSVSIGFVIVQPFSKDGVSFDAIYKVETLVDIEKKSPLIISNLHKVNLKNSNFLIGFEKFMFKNSDRKQTKSLALSMDETAINLGCLNSENLEFVQYAYIITKETVDCKLGEIIIFDQKLNRLSCQYCSELFQIPNRALDSCVCQDGYKDISSKCYKIPEGGKYNEKEKTFVCDRGHTMVVNEEKRRYECHLTPKNKMYNTDKQKWECISDFVEQDGECISVPENGVYDSKSKAIKCKSGFQLVSGLCIKAGQNQIFSISEGKFVCLSGYYRVEKECLKPFSNSKYDERERNFVCLDGYYPKQAGICDKLPKFMRYNFGFRKLECIEKYFEIKDQGCLEKPQKMNYNQDKKEFECVKDHYKVKGKCLKPGSNEEYSSRISDFICVSSTYRVAGECLKPKPNSYYSAISGKFECNENYYDIKGSCLTPPKNMRYSDADKKFVCVKDYQEVDSECLLIPANKVWNERSRKFVCVSDYFDMKDNSCQKPGKDETYDEIELAFRCKEGRYRERGQCTSLPPNSIYVKTDESFACKQKFFKRGSSCQSCSSDCEDCESDSKCTSCRSGFDLKSGKCSQICGDGIRFGAQCDDGNQENGDGCSKECMIENQWSCDGGSPYRKDTCVEVSKSAIIQEVESHTPIEMKMVGMSHLYAKIILNVKINYLPPELLASPQELENIFKILTNSQIPVKVAATYIERSTYTFVVVYDFNKIEPIPEYLTRVELETSMKEKYFPSVDVKSLFIKINPAFMALKGKHDDVL